MSDFFAPTVSEQIACIERELKMRQRVYPRWVSTGKMKQASADKEMAAMEAVLKTLKGLADV